MGITDGRISVEFCGEFKDLPEFNRAALVESVNKFIKKYGDEKEIFDVSLYLKKFGASYFGKSLIFCSLASNTTYGLVSSSSADWGLKKSLKRTLKSLVLEVNKLAERQLYGEYTELSV